MILLYGGIFRVVIFGLVLVLRSGNPAAGSGHSRIISDVRVEKEGHEKLKWNAAAGFKSVLRERERSIPLKDSF